jgi:hypothetical protein
VGRRDSAEDLSRLLFDATSAASNTTTISSTEFFANYRSAVEPSLFRIGAAAGDHFVR